MRRNNKGQAALVMIVILAMAFIFYSIELNWGRIADLKITTWVAAHSASSAMASNMASYAEKLMHEYLLIPNPNNTFDAPPKIEYSSAGYPFKNGDVNKITQCQGNWLLLRIIVAIIVIIIVAYTYGAAWPMAVAVLAAMFAITFILEFAIILPMEQALFNKLMKNLQPIDQYREYGVQTGLFAVASDNVQIPDRFDSNLNGKWGFNLDPVTTGERYQPNDTISRLSFYYAERLKHLKPQTIYPNAAYQDFLNTLGSFTGTTNVGGNATANGLLTVNTTGNSTNPYTGNSLNTSLFCNASKTRYATLDQFNNIGLTTTDATTIFNTLKTNGWASTAIISPNTPQSNTQADMIQLSADFTDTRIIATMKQTFGADADTIIAILQNDEKSNFNPICNPVCTHDASVADHNYALGWTYGNLTAAAQAQYVPDACQACTPVSAMYYDPVSNLYTNIGYDPSTGLCNGQQCNTPCPNFTSDGMDPNNYKLMYNPFLFNPIPPSALNPADKGYSWGARFGHDDELGKQINGGTDTYKNKNTSGIVFSTLDEMDNLQGAPQLSNLADAGAKVYDNQYNNEHVNDAVPKIDNPEIDSVSSVLPAISDTIQKMVNYKAPLNNCAYYNDSASGLFWKKGSDRYCSGTVQEYMKKDPNTGVFKTEYEIINALYPGSLASSSVKHWPYDDCTYMHDASSPDPTQQIACPDGSADQWPQDRLDAIVYGLPALIGLNQSLQGLTGEQLNMSINQWYPQVAKFIAPKCTQAACSQLQTLYPNTQQCTDLCQGDGCEGMDQNPIIQRMVTQFGNNPATCNPQYHGYVLQWWYDLQNWAKATYTWLYQTPSTGMCSGPLVGGDPGASQPTPGYFKLNSDGTHPGLPAAPGGSQAGNVVDCLYQKSYFYKELDDCWFGNIANDNTNLNEPKSGPFPNPVNNESVGIFYPYMSYACKKVIRDAQQDQNAVNFITVDVPKSLPPISMGMTPTELANYDYPPNPPYGAQGWDAQSKVTYDRIRAWVQANELAEVAAKARYGQLADLSYKAIDMMNLFNEGAADFYGFINPQSTNQAITTGDPTQGAVYELMGTRAHNGITSTLDLPRLPGFVIYGWQDKYKDTKKVLVNGGMSPTGRWHLARMEVNQPTSLPSINAHTEWGWYGWSGPMYNCLSGENIRGDVWTRATRWDAPAGQIANFGNQATHIWDFTFKDMTNRSKVGTLLDADHCASNNQYIIDHAQVIDSDPGQFLSQYCRGKNIGITQNTQQGYQVKALSNHSGVWPLPSGDGLGNLPPDTVVTNSDGSTTVTNPSISAGYPPDMPADIIKQEYFDLNDAFMFNYNPNDPSTGEYIDASDEAKNCYCIANYILATQGIMSYSGAHFAIPEKMTQGLLSDKGNMFRWHVEIKFNDLQDAKEIQDDYGDPIFPPNGDTITDDLSTETSTTSGT